MSDNLQPPVQHPAPPTMTPAVQAAADEAAREQRAANTMAELERAPLPPVKPAPAVAADSAEPRLAKMVRFEAGTVHDLMEHLKAWVDWRIAGGKSAKPGVSAEGVMDEPTRLAAAQRLGLSSTATQAQIEALDPSMGGPMSEPERLAAAQRLGLSSRATPEEIAAAEATRRGPGAQESDQHANAVRLGLAPDATSAQIATEEARRRAPSPPEVPPKGALAPDY